MFNFFTLCWEEDTKRILTVYSMYINNGLHGVQSPKCRFRCFMFQVTTKWVICCCCCSVAVLQNLHFFMIYPV